MPAFCCVADCVDRYSHSGSISYHKFPIKRPALLEKWLEFIGRSKDWTPSKWSTVCCRHFVTDAFSNLNGRKTLKKDAFPTITTYVNQKQENENICIKEVYTPPKSYVEHEPSKNVEQMPHEVFTNTAINPLVEQFCCLCYNNNRFDLSVVSDSNIFQYIQKCLPLLNIQHNDLLQVCSNCLEDIESLNRFIHKIAEAIRNQKVSKSNISSKSNERQLKIKQEPITRVKQECAEQVSDIYEEDFDYGFDDTIEHDHDCDVEQKFPFNSLSTLNTKDIINNCDIMEIVNLDDPFINIIDDDGNTNLEGFEEHTPPNETAAVVNNHLLQQLISEEHNYVEVARELKYEGQIRNVYKTEKNDSQDMLNTEDYMGDNTISENLSLNVKDISQSINNNDDNCRSLKPIVTSISNILDSSIQFPVNTNISTSKNLFVTSVRDMSTTEQAMPLLNNKPYTKPNIVVLNESIVKSPHAFCLQTCCVCQSNFFSVQALTQHYRAIHHQEPMVTIPTANVMTQNNENDVSIIKKGNLLNILNDSIDIDEFCKAIDLIENPDHNSIKNSKTTTSQNCCSQARHTEQNDDLEPTTNNTFGDSLQNSKKINGSVDLKQCHQKNNGTITNNEVHNSFIDPNKNHATGVTGVITSCSIDLKDSEKKQNSETSANNEIHYISTDSKKNNNIAPASTSFLTDLAQSDSLNNTKPTTSNKFQSSKCEGQLVTRPPMSKTFSTDVQQCKHKKSDQRRSSYDLHEIFIDQRKNNATVLTTKNGSLNLKEPERKGFTDITANMMLFDDNVLKDARKHNITSTDSTETERRKKEKKSNIIAPVPKNRTTNLKKSKQNVNSKVRANKELHDVLTDPRKKKTTSTLHKTRSTNLKKSKQKINSEVKPNEEHHDVLTDPRKNKTTSSLHKIRSTTLIKFEKKKSTEARVKNEFHDVFPDPGKNITSKLSKIGSTNSKKSERKENSGKTANNELHCFSPIAKRRKKTISWTSKRSLTNMRQYKLEDNNDVIVTSNRTSKNPNIKKLTKARVSKKSLTDKQQYKQIKNIKPSTNSNDSLSTEICAPEAKKKKKEIKPQVFQQLNRNLKRAKKGIESKEDLKYFDSNRFKRLLKSKIQMRRSGLNHSKNLLHCNKCQKIFGNIKKLIDHKKMSHYNNQKRIVVACVYRCNKIFHNKKARNLHMRYMCHGTVFNLSHPKYQVSSIQEKHKSRATVNKQTKSSIIENKVSYKLKHFVNNINNEKSGKQRKTKKKSGSFKCSFCQKEFQYKKHLKQHSITHENSKFKCSLCEKTFQRKHGMDQHVRVFHMGIRPFKCNVCSRPFSLKHDMLLCKHKKSYKKSTNRKDNT
ncbi:uncharacterized protein LOC119687960 [Teleopsis dalmanni]|uniref:uncharacterized protein LOC119687960 n=1 Tax=Teleopsis dalmanni TaxID=139649 RepID=UPI0018CD0DBD|nr:uncharacterized protein LOC119687960 [Teleopsis dalmanni]